LVEALTKAGALTPGPRQLSAEEMQQMVADVAKVGDAARGETIFRRRDLACVKCHALGGAGGQVGPDLASVGASAPVDYLIDSLLLPNKAIKENYHSLVVGTNDGRILTGIKVRETNTELVLRNAEDREIAIPRSTIAERAPGGSLMPDGLTDNLTRAELLHLVRFLSELGKIGPYALDKAPVVRRWQTLDPTPASRTILERRGIASVADNEPALAWSPAYALVNGALPLDAVATITLSDAETKETRTMGIARWQLDVSTAGKVRLLLNSIEGVQLWAGTSRIEAKPDILLDLRAGIHTITVAVDLGRRHEAIRCQLADVAGSPVRAQIVGGK
jgi:putative heme-binding domain-containing protein